MFKHLIFFYVSTLFCSNAFCQQRQSFNSNWEFVKNMDTAVVPQLFASSNSLQWQKISLPHTASIEPVEKVAQQWQGTCFYRKYFTVAGADKGKHIALQFDAAMHEADVYLNGEYIFKHLGGYLPFYIEISDKVKFGQSNTLLIKLNNQDNPAIPPAKPLKDLDFNFYSGIYRNAWLITKNKVHISNAIAANHTAGGGVVLHYQNVISQQATMLVQTEVENDLATVKNIRVKAIVTDNTGKIITQATSELSSVKKGAPGTFAQTLQIPSPKLWSPDAPYLYSLSVQVLQNGKLLDQEQIKTGIKAIRFDSSNFYLNGKPLKIRGTNRHQEYPYVGYAISDNAQYRDAWKIKDAGFNFVRCSHYPQSPAFLDACDQLGIMVMDGIPGWQYFGNEAFQQNSYQDTKDMVRRDRNHACVILWESSLNETDMKKPFMDKQHKLVHEELPFENVYTAGWMDYGYDVFIPARQHAKAPDYWNKYSGGKPLLIAEYGDWEYYAGNAGFNQKDYADLKTEERTSRQLRGYGEKRLLQQATNYQEAHNDNLKGNAVGDANWLMFDYKRGYADDIESSGIMDIFRLPKFAFYFYQSQQNIIKGNPGDFYKPKLFIANYWQSASDTVVKIYSNCDAVELLVNGKLIGRQQPDKDYNSTNLNHPPFTFHLPAFAPGTLTAKGFISNKQVLSKTVNTPGKPAGIRLLADISGKKLDAGTNDVVFIYAAITDSNGTTIPDADNNINFEVKGDATIAGPASVKTEAGIATILLQAGVHAGSIKITATSKGLPAGVLEVMSFPK